MANDGASTDFIDYERLSQEAINAAMRNVMRAALERAASGRGLPGEHHFYISFITQAAGVSIPAELKNRYPDEMTIVLQNQFWDLNPGETAFSVTLQFGGQPKSLSIPYAAISRFYDPSVKFQLQFADVPSPAAGGPIESAPVTTLKPSAPAEAKTRSINLREKASESVQPNVVAIDKFRKK